MAVLSAVTRILGVGYVQSLTRRRGWSYVASWAHRISGIFLVIYLWFHLITLSSLRDPEVFEGKMKLFAAYFPAYLEWLLAIPVIYHALNGGRLILYELFGNRQDHIVARWVMILSAAYLALLGIFMALGNQSISAVLFWGYMAAGSSLLTYITTMKCRSSGASTAWKMQRITGTFLVLMIPAHMLFMHLDPTIGRETEIILARMDNGFIKLVDLLLVLGVLYHAGYGLISICQDYLASRKIRLSCTAGTIVIMSLFAFIGVRLTLMS